jgi:hypothetical protein
MKLGKVQKSTGAAYTAPGESKKFANSRLNGSQIRKPADKAPLERLTAFIRPASYSVTPFICLIVFREA